MTSSRTIGSTDRTLDIQTVAVRRNQTSSRTAGCFDTVTVMIQREVARRLCARPGTADYGALTVFVQWHAEPELLFDVPPHCFVPAPKVTSTVVRLRVRKAPPVAVQDEKLLFTVVRAAFNQRRKTLINALSAGVPGLSLIHI